MEIEIDLNSSAQENANSYFSNSKKARRKIAGAQISITELEKKLAGKREKFEKQSSTKKMRKIEKREWYEKFHWFFTSSNMIAIGGKDAVQNEALNSKHFSQKDLFFHADVFGASVVILVDGINSDAQTREEVAQFAACYSSAWKRGVSTTDVYAMKREQVSKSSRGGSLATGSFALSGEREWYRNMKLELVAFIDKRNGDKLSIAPSNAFAKLEGEKGVRITIGEKKKSDAAKIIAKKLGYEELDYIMQLLPAGAFQIE